MASHRAGEQSRARRGGPAACSAVTVLALVVTCTTTGPVKLAAVMILLGTLVCALGIAQRAGLAAVAPALGLAVAFLVLIGLALAAFHALASDPVAAAIGAVTLAAAWSAVRGPAARGAPGAPDPPGIPDPGTTARLPRLGAVAGAVIFVAAAAWSVHYSSVSATADSSGASSLAVWAYPSGHRLDVGAQQPPGRGPVSLRIVVTHAGITAAAWDDVRLAPGRTWRAPPLTLTGPGPTTVVAWRGGVVVARLPAH
ncbi:MAG: hypothetical protein ACR2MP_14720 [Streptosporangiaceae bacterium]